MIWYLLYPFRGTTEPPLLAQDHPIRRVFVRHGTVTAQHWLLSILLSVAVAVLLCYPVLFLYDSPTTGLYNIPHHVWTAATPFHGSADSPYDVEVRQVWVHGSYMKALELQVLKDALKIQDALLGPGFEPESPVAKGVASLQGREAGMSLIGQQLCTADKVEDMGWSFHSPLMYWNCSLAPLEADSDVLATINSQADRRTYVNLTLRPSSVFAGKAFSKKRLLAADALVITVLDRKGIGKLWDERLKNLVEDGSDSWSLYPPNGVTGRSQLFEFRFKPMSLHDDFFLALAYCFTVLYVIVSLRKLRAVKSKFGLVITAFSQITTSVFASFTICGMLKINLTQIPREMYPFVVVILGLEDMFRLINAVLAHPPEMPPVQRIANALGDVGHLSLAAVAQNLGLLYILYHFVPSGVGAFCVFTAVALIFEFLFHLIFFIAVLSVDVRRMELQDSLDRISLAQTNTKTSKTERQTWAWALLSGRLPFTTRVAGSIVTICFILALNWHFFDDTRGTSIFRFLRLIQSANWNGVSQEWIPPPPIHQARTPAAWLKMQDHETAREVIRLIKPHAHSFVARLHDPLTVVLKGADRTGSTGQPNSFLLALRTLTEEHFFPIALAVVFTIAAVTLLMNYLLWNELPDESQPGEEDDWFLLIRSLPNAHNLDIVRITACGKGHFVSVSLDRTVGIWVLNARTNSYSLSKIGASTLKPPLWPVMKSTIDDTGNWLALCTDSGRIGIWSLAERTFVKSVSIDLKGQSLSFFGFVSLYVADLDHLDLVAITSDGWLKDVDLDSGQLRVHEICKSPLLASTFLLGPTGKFNIINAARNGGLHISHFQSGQWRSRPLQNYGPRLLPDGKLSKVRSVLAVPALNLVVAVRLCEVDVIDLVTGAVIHTFQTSHAKGNSLRVLHSPKRTCTQCNCIAVHSFTIAYTEAETQNVILQSYTLQDDDSTSSLCFRSSSGEDTKTCRGLEHARETLHCVDRGGVWEATLVQSIIGVRKRQISTTYSSNASATDMGYFSTFPNHPVSILKRRIRESRPTPSASKSSFSSNADFDEWETWTMSCQGEMDTKPLLPRSEKPSEDGSMEQLFVTSPGPIARLGKRAVAVGFGNTVKLIMLGTERFEEDANGAHDLGLGNVNRRRRVATRKMQ